MEILYWKPKLQIPRFWPWVPVASQLSIKLLGTNGGGFFNTNSAHPFENPTAFANLLEMLCIFLIPAALCFTFGRMVSDKRQGVAIFSAMLAIFLAFTIAVTHFEQVGNPDLATLGVDKQQTIARLAVTWKEKKYVLASQQAACLHP